MISDSQSHRYGVGIRRRRWSSHWVAGAVLLGESPCSQDYVVLLSASIAFMLRVAILTERLLRHRRG